MTIGELIKDYCNKNKISQYEFSEMVGMSSVSVSKIVRENRLPAIPYLKNIAKVLDMTFMELIHEHYSTMEKMEVRTIV